jgi:hypothetical protein
VTVFKRKPKSDKPAKAAAPAKAKKEKPAAAPKKRDKAIRKTPAALTAVKKQPTDIYTVMLIIAMVAVLIACVLLFMELSTYGSYPWWKAV